MKREKSEETNSIDSRMRILNWLNCSRKYLFGVLSQNNAQKCVVVAILPPLPLTAAAAAVEMLLSLASHS